MVAYFVKVFELYPPKSAWGGCVLGGQRLLRGGQGCHSLPLQRARWKAEGWVAGVIFPAKGDDSLR